MIHDLSLFIFRRDLRLSDNTGLLKAMSESETVIPLFICTPTQLDNNKYKSENAIQFMIESLYDLDKQINKVNNKCRLWVAYGDEIDIIKKIYKSTHFTAIYLNDDYSPYAVSRDKQIKSFCEQNKIDYISSTDILLTDTLEIQTNAGSYYSIFTQFYNKAVEIKIRNPMRFTFKHFKPQPSIFKSWKIYLIDEYLLENGFYHVNPKIAIQGGRSAGLRIIKGIEKFATYKKTHDQLSINTTRLSPHNKFGTLSVREVYFAFKVRAKSVDLCKQLYWRDFYYYISAHFKELFKYQHLKRPIKKKVKWGNSKKYYLAWKNARTGFPIVDAAMRELNETGFMHNRGRLIVSSFLVKDLLIDWKYGDLHFSQKLIDIDRCVNTGNWNWSASFGLDSTPFLRILNPWQQSKKFDPKAEYIKKWIPELANVPANYLHNWEKYASDYSDINYPKPIIKHSEQRKEFIKFYNKYFK